MPTNDLEFVTTEALLSELHRRYDASVFIASTSHDKEHECNTFSIKDEISTIQAIGLVEFARLCVMRFAAASLAEAETKREPEDNEGDEWKGQ